MTRYCGAALRSRVRRTLEDILRTTRRRSRVLDVGGSFGNRTGRRQEVWGRLLPVLLVEMVSLRVDARLGLSPRGIQNRLARTRTRDRSQVVMAAARGSSAHYHAHLMPPWVLLTSTSCPCGCR